MSLMSEKRVGAAAITSGVAGTATVLVRVRMLAGSVMSVKRERQWVGGKGWRMQVFELADSFASVLQGFGLLRYQLRLLVNEPVGESKVYGNFALLVGVVKEDYALKQ